MCIRDRTFTVACLVAVALGSVLFNVPRFLRDEPLSHVGAVTGGQLRYFVYVGPLRRHPGVERAYSWTYFTLGISRRLRDLQLLPECSSIYLLT